MFSPYGGWYCGLHRSRSITALTLQNVSGSLMHDMTMFYFSQTMSQATNQHINWRGLIESITQIIDMKMGD